MIWQLDVLQYVQMRDTFTIRLDDELRIWLKTLSEKTGMPVGQIIREQLEHARGRNRKGFMRHAGAVNGTPDLSSRKGFKRQ